MSEHQPERGAVDDTLESLTLDLMRTNPDEFYRGWQKSSGQQTAEIIALRRDLAAAEAQRAQLKHLLLESQLHSNPKVRAEKVQQALDLLTPPSAGPSDKS